MTPLRQQMIEAMQLRGFSPRTHESYLYTVEQLVRYHRIAPDRLTTPQLQAFFKHLALEKELAPASCRGEMEKWDTHLWETPEKWNGKMGHPPSGSPSSGC